VAGACATTAPPSAAPPTASPTSAPVAGCWVATRGEYRIQPFDGAAVNATDVEDTARIVQQRLASLGLVEYEVSVGEGGTVVVLQPAMPEDALLEARQLIAPAGIAAFVPIPDGESVESGDSLPSGLTPLFGHAAIGDARAGEDETGRAAVDITLTDAGRMRLAAFTRENVGSTLAITLDGTVLTAPTIVAPIESGTMQVSGVEDASQLATILSLPPLIGPLDEITFTEVERPAGCPV
jgi:preprotein translocase subunit SecD